MALYGPKDEVNLWKFPPPVRKLLIARLFEGLIIPAAMLTDEQFGIAAQGALSGYKLVPPRKGFKYPIEPRALDLVAAGEVLDLWNRPAVRIVIPRVMIKRTNYSTRNS